MADVNYQELIGFDPDELRKTRDLPPGHPVRYARESEERVQSSLGRLAERVAAVEKRFEDLLATVNRELDRPINITAGAITVQPASVTVQPAEVVVKTMPAPKVDVKVNPTPVEVKVEPAKVEIPPPPPPATRPARTVEINRDKDGTLRGTIRDAS